MELDDEISVKGLKVSGYDSNDMIDNLETLYVFMFLSLCIFLLMPLCCIIPHRFAKKVFSYWVDFFFWDALVRFMLESQLEIAVGSLLTLQVVSMKTEDDELTFKTWASWVISIIFITCFIFLPFVFVFYLKRSR